ncbi:MAG TPA: efflux RND transporter permease subunit [Chthoniobacteraceae bacterium]|jgi:hydrophobe/amphiphile efflux-1 (HAE1) family protein|nr:efflux RND transporter permease subunit [Chthoniobacteraceae bacterium]
MFLPQISIKRPVLTVMMSLALVLFGVIGLLRLPVRELPNIDPPIVNVMTVFPGANASVVETEVTERLEEELNSIEGIKTLTSESKEQVSNITIEFTLARPIDVCAQDVRDRVARVRGKLPDDIDEPIIAKQEADAQPVIWIAVHSERFNTLELSKLAERQLKDVLQTVSGVSQIVIGGEKRFAIRVWLDAQKMAARGVTISDVERAMKEQNVELPSGRVENLDREMTIQTLGELKNAEQFNDLVIRNEGATLVRLRDIGEARTGPEDLRSIGRYNGKPAVALGVVKQTQANTIEVARAIKREIERMKPTLPDSVHLDLPYDESDYVSAAIGEVWTTLAVAFGLVVIVIYIFLRNFRSTIIPTVAIPVSLIGTFAALYFLGYSINILTMLALVLSIGIVVDDAIVVLENIHRYVELGHPPMEAAKKAMEEIAFAIIAITFSLVAVFTPLAFQTSTTGRLFLEFAATVAVSVIISAFVALSLTPMMSARILKSTHRERQNFVLRFFERFMAWVTRTYERWLDRALRHRVVTISVGASSLAAAIWLLGVLEKDFLPEEDKGRLFNVVVAPEGSTSEYTDRQIRKMEKIVESFPETDSYFSAVALSRGGPGDPSSGLMFIKFKPEPRRSVQDIVGGPTGMQARFFGEIEGALAFAIVPKAIGRGFGQSLALELQNQDLDALSKYAGQLANKLRGEGYLLNVRSVFQIDKPELRVTIDRDRAAALGVSIEEISRSMQILFGGLDLSKVKIDGKEYDVIAQLERESRLTAHDLESAYVRSRTGQLVQLASVVHTEAHAAPGQINHYNRLRSAEIQATPVGVPLGTAVQRIEQLLRADLPPGFRYEWSGEAKDLKDTGTEVYFVLLLAIIIVYMVLAAQFESLVHPFTVMLALPLAAFGALGALWLMSQVNALGTTLYGWTHFAPSAPGWAKTLSHVVPRIPAMNINLFSQIGLVLLVGLVTKNSILLVEFANQQMEKGKAPLEAMKLAGLTRLRPILMTSFATIAGIMPIAIGFGAGAESRRPMGVAVIGGMLTSTFLTLLVIPVVYTLFADAARWRRQSKTPPTAKTESRELVSAR